MREYHIWGTSIFLPVNSISELAGHYVPQLAEKIYDYNKATSQRAINLKGFIVSYDMDDFEMNFW